MLNFCQVHIPWNQFLWRNQPIKIKFLDTHRISFYYITQYVFIYHWAKFHENILCLGVDFKQNVHFLPSPYAQNQFICTKKSIYKNKVSGYMHNFFLLYDLIYIYTLLSKISWKKNCVLWLILSKLLTFCQVCIPRNQWRYTDLAKIRNFA